MDNEIEIIEDNNPKKGSKRPYIVGIVLALVLVITITITSYAFFTATISNTTAPNENVITTGTMALEFTDGPEVTLENAVPGSQVVKTFKVKNSGSVETRYDVYFSRLINTFADRADLVYTIESNDGGYSNLTEKILPSEAAKLVDQQLIGVNEEHNYTLTIKFKESNDNQNNNLNKKFSTKLDINKYEELASITINTYNATVNPSVVYAEVGQKFLDVLPTPVVDKGYEFDRYIHCDYHDVSSESKITRGGNYCVIAVIRQKNGNYYWNDNYSQNVYQTNTMPSNFETDYTNLITNNEPTGFIRTTVENNVITKHETCLYYNNSLFCSSGSKYSNYFSDASLLDVFKNDMATALGEVPTCRYTNMTYECKYSNASCFLGIDVDLHCGANNKYCVDETNSESGFGAECYSDD